MDGEHISLIWWRISSFISISPYWYTFASKIRSKKRDVALDCRICSIGTNGGRNVTTGVGNWCRKHLRGHIRSKRIYRTRQFSIGYGIDSKYIWSVIWSDLIRTTSRFSIGYGNRARLAWHYSFQISGAINNNSESILQRINYTNIRTLEIT